MISYNQELNDWMSMIVQRWDNFYVFLYKFWQNKTVEGYIKIVKPYVSSYYNQESPVNVQLSNYVFK